MFDIAGAAKMCMMGHENLVHIVYDGPRKNKFDLFLGPSIMYDRTRTIINTSLAYLILRTEMNCSSICTPDKHVLCECIVPSETKELYS